MGFSEQPEVLPCTHNMVSTVHFKGSQPKIDLAFIASSTRYSTYDRKRFAAITIRINNPKVTALLFSSGKLVVTGAVSRQMGIFSKRRIIGMIRALYCRSTFTYGAHCTQNIVCNVHVPGALNIDITRIYSDKNSQCTYQPKIFPGLIFRPSCSPIVLLIFKSSRIIVTGARTYADILSGFAEIFEVLRPYFTQCVQAGEGAASAGDSAPSARVIEVPEAGEGL